MNPDGEQDYQGHPKPRRSDWPIGCGSLFLIVLVLCVTAICITNLITRN